MKSLERPQRLLMLRKTPSKTLGFAFDDKDMLNYSSASRRCRICGWCVFVCMWKLRQVM